jgi:pimeloyl-ACP methyl ester carboxylesterase
MMHPTYRTADVDGFEVFYREAGDRAKPTLLLLHGFPTSSHMFRDLIPLLADRFHLVGPDLPGFGLSALPARNQFAYTFDNLAQVIGRFTEVIGLDQFAIYIFDYGAPTGLRMAMAHPERITAIISQNGNAYKEGLSDGWNPIERYWRDPSDANRQGFANCWRQARSAGSTNTAFLRSLRFHPMGSRSTRGTCCARRRTRSSST